MKRFALFFVAPTLALLLAAVAPLVLGTGTLYTRDVLSGHFAMKTGQALTAEEGGAALIDPYRGGGQPSMGNPNSLPLYPTNLLFRVASPWWSLNAHFWIHWLLAPFAGFWLGRAWGLTREGSWSVGVCYAGSGFLLSLFNLYNLISGAVLAPALVAAALDAAHPTRRRATATLEVGALWGLSLLSGDPLFSALSALLAVGAVLLRHRDGSTSANSATSVARLVQSLRGVLPVAGPMAVGTLLASPMLVEMFRILPLSFRGYWQYSAAAVLSQSWDPRAVGEWFLPFVFGRPDFTFWGFRFYGGNPPLLYSLYPGLAALLLVATAGLPRLSKRPLLWSWLAMLAGLFLALGAHNPVVRALLQLPGASLLRYPVKCWLLVAVGGALACGVGFDRLVDGPGRRVALRVGAVLTGGFALVWGALSLLPAGLERALVGLDPLRPSTGLFEAELPRWQGLSLLSLALAGLLMACSAMAERRPRVAGALILALHLASQTFFLEPLFHADDVAHYRTPPPALAHVPEGARIVHGGFGESFGRLPGSPLEVYPDARFFWLARTHFEELQPFAAVQWGLRSEMFHSPEGLDSFYQVSMTRALRRLDDSRRIGLLRASGVDTLLLGRPLDPSAARLVDLRAVLPSAGHALHIYGIRDPAPEVALVGSVRRAPHMDSALATLTDPSFDPRTTVVVPGDGPPVDGPAGEVEVLVSTPERLEARVRSTAGGVLVTQRAFLGIHRARIDGEWVEPLVANGHRIGIRVPAGDHEVALWVDRRAYRLGWMAAILAALGLFASVFAARSMFAARWSRTTRTMDER